MALILLVEDENLLRLALRRRLEQQGHTVHEAVNLAAADRHLREHRPDIAILDVHLPDGNGIDFLDAQRDALAESVVLVMTAVGEVEDAVRAIKCGAFDYLTKPIKQDDLLVLVTQALDRQRERIDAEGSRRDRERLTRVNVVGDSPGMRSVLETARTVAVSPAMNVLLEGETGTGKEVVARYIHAASPRSQGPLLALNCAALPEQLVESELFGHERGAFTDAKSFRKGIFELAAGGTVILDEIGELPLPLQAKFLRVLEERTFRRVGGTREIGTDARVIALTNRDLWALAKAGGFRSDLFYRLNVFPITVPPLRERREDVVPLAMHFLRQFGANCGKHFRELSPALEAQLLRHDWPGNVRELRNLVERISILEPGGVAQGRFVDLGGGSAVPGSARTPAADEIIPLDEVEFTMVERAMRTAGGNQSQAARLLGVSRDQVRYRIKRYRAEGRWESNDDEVDTGDDEVAPV